MDRVVVPLACPRRLPAPSLPLSHGGSCPNHCLGNDCGNDGAGIKSHEGGIRSLLPTFRKGVWGSRFDLITHNIKDVISYATKPPSYGYAELPKGSERHPPEKLTLKAVWQLRQIFRNTRWRDLMIHVGEGDAVMRGILRGLKLPLAESPTSLRADLLEQPDDKQDGVDSGKAGELTIGSMVNPDIEVADKFIPIQEQAANATGTYMKFVGVDETANSLLHTFIAQCYEGALTSKTKAFGQLEKLLEQKGIPYNRGTDLFLTFVKLVIPAEHHNIGRMSNYATALRYMHREGCQINQVPFFLSTNGGVRGCADKWREIKKTAAQERLEDEVELIQRSIDADDEDDNRTGYTPSSPARDDGRDAGAGEVAKGPTPHHAAIQSKALILSPQEAWTTMNELGFGGFKIAANHIDMLYPKCIAFLSRNLEKNRLCAHHVISLENEEAQEFLIHVATALKRKHKHKRN